MAPAPIKPFEPFIQHLGPTAALQETIYGLVMVLATLSAFSVAFGLNEETRWTVVFASLAVSVAWGFVDMVMWIFTRNFDRLRQHYLAASLKKNPGESGTVEAVQDDLSDTIVGTLAPADRERIYKDVLESAKRAPPMSHGIERGAFWGGLSAFLITMIATVPVLAPVALVDPPMVGLRIANIMNVVLLFVVGYSWASYAGLKKWKVGITLAVIGTAVTLTTIALGG